MKRSVPAQLRIVPITKDNWEEAASLRVDADQSDHITPNIWSIAESGFYEALKPTAIYDRQQMVGFLMWGVDPLDGRCWLYRFMIDRDHQRKGYGTAALRALIEHLQRIPGCTELNVGYHRDNVAAERLYLSLGFEKTGVAPWGELTARLRWDRSVTR